jgi:DNA helicase-2/ATP-dependent DNA helicase PcrA
MLEPKHNQPMAPYVIESLELMANLEQASGTSGGREKARQYRKWAAEYAQGKKFLKNGIVACISSLIAQIAAQRFTGDPRTDWVRVKDVLRRCSDQRVSGIAGYLDYPVAFSRGRILTANLSSLWLQNGDYAGARDAFDAALAQDAILESSQDTNGLHVMTIHRAKGKQFDGVIIFRKGVAAGPKQWRSSFVWRDDTAPYERSRKILRVAITRAKQHVLILDPPYPQCPLLLGHVL